MKCDCGKTLYEDEPPCHEKCGGCGDLFRCEEFYNDIYICKSCLFEKHEHFTITVLNVNDKIISAVTIGEDIEFMAEPEKTPAEAIRKAVDFCKKEEYV